MRLPTLVSTTLAVLTLSGVAQGAQPDTLKSIAKGDMAALEASSNRSEPNTPFWDAQGHRVTLADLKPQEKILVVDLWATWCAGCVQEMPTFAKLQSVYRGRIVVVPISMDLPKNREKARAFMAQFPQLSFYQNTTEHWPPAITTALDPKVGSFPTALIFGPDRKEIARLTGKTTHWNGRDARALFDYLLKGNPQAG
jgi:thiol-disulfide isomerase/thioredoxin